MLDIKQIDNEKHKILTSQNNDRILAFAEYLSDNNIPIWIRHVVVPGYTDKKEDWYKLGQFIGKLKTLKALDCLPYHTMGVNKYHSLNIPYPLEGVEPAPKELAANAKKEILYSSGQLSLDSSLLDKVELNKAAFIIIKK